MTANLYSRYAGNYVKSDVKTAGGKRKSMDKGDALAQALRGKSVEELSDIATTNKIDVARWTHLNPGRFRMQVGRALRLIIKNGKSIKVGKTTIKEL